MLKCVSLMLLPALALAAEGLADPYAKAMALKEDGRHAEAVQVLETLLTKQPGHRKALFQSATMLAWQNRYDEAEARYRKGLALYPEDPDLRLGLARLQYWRGEHSASLSGLDALLGERPHDAEALALRADVLRAAASPASRAWRVDAGLTWHTFTGDDGGRDDETDAFAQLGRRWARGALAGGVERLERFGSVDVRGNLQAWYDLASEWHLDVLVMHAPDADVQADWQYGVGLAWDVAEDWTISGRWSRSDYQERDDQPAQIIDTGALGAIRRWGGSWSAGVEARVSRSEGQDPAAVGLLRIDRIPSGDLGGYLLLAHGEEDIPPEDRVRVTTIAGGLGIDLDAAATLYLDGTFEDREEYERWALGLRATFRF